MQPVVIAIAAFGAAVRLRSRSPTGTRTRRQARDDHRAVLSLVNRLLRRFFGPGPHVLIGVCVALCGPEHVPRPRSKSELRVDLRR